MNDISTSPSLAVETHNALDAAFKQVTSQEAPAAETPAAAAPAGEATAAPAAAAAVAAPAAAATETPAAAAPAVTPVETPAATPAVVKDALDEVEIPPYSKPKSVEAFTKIKTAARETIAKRDAEIERLTKERTELEAKLKTAPTPEQTAAMEKQAKEIEELRNFRRAADIENDTDFKAKYDGKIESNNATILAKLIEAGLQPDSVEIAKKVGVENLEWEPIFENLTPAMRHYISAKLGQNLELRDERKAAVDAARKEPSKFESQRMESQAKTITETANECLKNMGWTATKEIPATATPAEKVEIEAHNKIATEAQDRVKTLLKDYNPATFAELAVGTAAAHKWKATYDNLKTTHDAVVAKNKTDLDAVSKELAAVKTELENIKKAGKTHIRTSATPAPAAPNLLESGASAVDRLFREISK